MSRVVRIVISCDGAPGEDCAEEVQDDRPVLWAWGGKTYSRDLCETHREPFIGLLDVLATRSQEVTHTRPAVGEKQRRADHGVPRGKQPRITCPVPGCGVEMARSSLVKHRRTKHPEQEVASEQVPAGVGG